MPKMPSRLKFVSRLTGYTAISVGILVIAGWLLDVEPLKTFFPGLPAMNLLTAVAFVLAGVSLRLMTVDPADHKALRTARVCASAVLFIAVVCWRGMHGSDNSGSGCSIVINTP
jgi:hypothetical protein